MNHLIIVIYKVNKESFFRMRKCGLLNCVLNPPENKANVYAKPDKV